MKVTGSLIKYATRRFAGSVDTIAKNKLNIQSVCTTGNRANIPLSCFSRTKNGDFIIISRFENAFWGRL